MHRIKNAFTVLIFLSIINISFLQSQPYFKIGGGYNLDFGGVMLSQKGMYKSVQSNNTTQYTDQVEGLYSSFGKGYVLNGTVGMKFTPNIGGEVSIEYDLGSTYEGTFSDYSYVNTTLNNFYESTAKWSFSMVNINPSVVISTDSKQIDPYIKAGFIVSIPKIAFDYQTRTLSGTGYSDKNKYSGGLGIGFNGAFGATKFMNENITLWGEVNYKYVSWEPTKLEETDTQGKTTTYDLKESYTYTYHESNGVRIPEQTTRLTSKLPFSSIGFTIGVQLNWSN